LFIAKVSQADIDNVPLKEKAVGLSGSFAWIRTVTDRFTQWTEYLPAWNRGGAQHVPALRFLFSLA